MMNEQDKRWVEGAVVYQIYPRSFKDSNADGVGDIPGITSQLDYLSELGITAVWLSPFYPSPMADFGYDIADYCDVDPLFGTLDDFRTLLAEAHSRDIRVIVDLVPNHTSDEHDWFIESARSRDNPKADWYIWHEGRRGDDGHPQPPNNWVEVFSGESAWQWHEGRQQYYMHSFNVHQPDLNWENPAVRAAMQDVMRFWLDIGVDGFRVDAVNFMAKDRTFPDEPASYGHDPARHAKYGALQHIYSQGTGQLFGFMRDLAGVLQEAPYRTRQPFMVSEAYPQGDDHIAEYARYYREVDPQVAAPFNFEGLESGWNAEAWATFLPTFKAALDAVGPHCVMSFALGNHDQSRLATRLGEAAARSAAVLLLSLPGMSFIYNGDEIAMCDGVIPPEAVKDPGASGGDGRDPERTPLQWSAASNGGFSEAAETWLPVNDDYMQRNIEAQRDDPTSTLTLYRTLLSLRAQTAALQSSDLAIIESGCTDVLALRRGADVLVLVNFSDQPIDCKPDFSLGNCLVSSQPHSMATAGETVTLTAHEAVIFQAAAQF